MKILLIGSGGREHAMAWKLAQSKHVEIIYVAPGNAGTGNLTKCCNVDVYSNDGFLTFAKDNKIDLTIVGPEQPLVDGIVDLFKKNKLAIFGPSKNGAMLEGSKIFSKNFMKRYGVETSKYTTYDNHLVALIRLKNAQYPLVIKANGLAAGKGVEICANFEQAEQTINRFMIDGLLKDAGKSIVVEEFLSGVEASIICITDGKDMVPLLSAQDHKTIYENNEGPNTGGMGAVVPNPHVTKDVMDDFIENIMNPTLAGIKKEKFDYCGFLFFGVMITRDGCKCLEYNVRMGDPECQSIIPMMGFDLLDMISAAMKKQLHKFKFSWKKGVTINVVLTSKGYPETFQKGSRIMISGKPLVFMAGATNKNEEIVTNGGRVLSVVATDTNIDKARVKVYREIANVRFDDSYYRKDIGSN